MPEQRRPRSVKLRAWLDLLLASAALLVAGWFTWLWVLAGFPVYSTVTSAVPGARSQFLPLLAEAAMALAVALLAILDYVVHRRRR